jgi:hypothetical protein
VMGSLPPGLTLDGKAGTITGTPTTVGTTSLTLVATDSATPPAQATQPTQLQILAVGADADAGGGSDDGGNGSGSSPSGHGGGGCGCHVSSRSAGLVDVGALLLVTGVALLGYRRRRTGCRR